MVENPFYQDAKCWIRKIVVKLTSKKDTSKVMVFGDTPLLIDQSIKNIQHRSETVAANEAQYKISIDGVKKLATSEDHGTIVISNIDTLTVMEMIEQEYYILEIWAGYGTDIKLQVKGEVSYISQKLTTRRDQDTYIHFASTLVARWSQARMNFSMSSGINMYNAVRSIIGGAGISANTKISEELKTKYLNNVISEYSTTANAFTALENCSDGSFTFNTDEAIDGSVISCTTIQDKRFFDLTAGNILIAGGNPTVTSDGLRITILPTVVFTPGDIIKIDNAIIDISVQSSEAVLDTFNQNFLDHNGQYMIYEIDYSFENRGDNFQYNIRARALDTYISKLGVAQS